jgi:hypothetical protein
MPSPFPGIDPYVEAEGDWSDFHVRMSVLVSRDIMRLRRPRFRAELRKRVTWLGWHEFKYMYGFGQPDEPVTVELSSAQEADNPLIMCKFPIKRKTEVHQYYIDVMDRENQNNIVTRLEFLMPFNKTGTGRKQYRQAQKELLRSSIHLVEIDLCMSGHHTAAVPTKSLWEHHLRPRFMVCVSRHPLRDQFEVYPFQLKDRLPRIKLPLGSPEEDVCLDLNAALADCYAEAYYAERYDYHTDPVDLALMPSERSWLDQHLRQQGKR